jgi:hypothetical protein
MVGLEIGVVQILAAQEPRPGATVADPNKKCGIRDLIGQKILDGETHFWVDWEPTWIAESELDEARELIDNLNTHRAGVGTTEGNRRKSEACQLLDNPMHGARQSYRNGVADPGSRRNTVEGSMRL